MPPPIEVQLHQRRESHFFSSTGGAEIYDLSQDYATAANVDLPEVQEMLKFAQGDKDVNAFVAIECGEIVGEYYDSGKDAESQFQLWSMTKTWSGMLFGIMEKEGLLSVDETLGDVWPDDAIWAGVEDAEDRKQATIENILQMRAGFNMSE